MTQTKKRFHKLLQVKASISIAIKLLIIQTIVEYVSINQFRCSILVY